MWHLVRTPIGIRVKGEACLKEVDGRRLLFEAEVYDEKKKIAEGEDDHFILKGAKFMERIAQHKTQGEGR